MGDLREKFEHVAAKYCKPVPVRHFNYAVNISLKYNYFYVETPKVACSTIKSVLQRAELNAPELFRENFQDIHNREFSPLLRPSQVGDLDSYFKNNTPFKFCFVRNPYTRLLSVYLDKITKICPQKRLALNCLGRDINQLDQPVLFDEFVRMVCEQTVESMDPHWRVQYYQSLQDYISYDFIGKFEQFSHDFSHVLKTLTINSDKFYATEQRHAQHAGNFLGEYYTPSLLELVNEKYSIDFDCFSYQKMSQVA